MKESIQKSLGQIRGAESYFGHSVAGLPTLFQPFDAGPIQPNESGRQRTV